MKTKSQHVHGGLFLGTACLLASLSGVGACTEISTQSVDEAEAIAICKAEACIEEIETENVADPETLNAGNIIKTGDNYWIGMTDNAANQTLAGWLEKYCGALNDKAGCFGTHGSPGGGLQVTPSACQISAVKDGPPYMLFICSAAAGPNSALDYFVGKTCAKPADVYGCDGTLWVFKPKADGTGLKAHCQGNWKNGSGNATPPFTGIEWTAGDTAPAGEDWQSLCGG